MLQVKKADWGDRLAELCVKLFFWSLGIIGAVLLIVGFLGNWFLMIIGGLFITIFLWAEFPDLC